MRGPPGRPLILHLVTDRRRLSPSAGEEEARACLLRQIAWAVAAGVDAVQVRERELEAAQLASLVTAAVALTRGTATRVIVNDRLDVAVACGADGVHLGGHSVPVGAARAIAPAGFLIGRSVHSLDEWRVHAAGADYLIAGTVWPTESKPGQRTFLGPAGLAEIAAAAGVPVLAVGGVTVERTAAVAASGAAGVAAVGLFMGAAGSGADARCLAVPLEELAAGARTAFDTPGSAS